MTSSSTFSVEGDLSKAVESKLTVTETHGGEADGKGKYDRWSLLDDSTIDYGYLAQTKGAGINTATDNKTGFYLTTAINYTNGPAHMGHAYEGTTSDVITRYFRLKGDQPCYFVTGADEHGQKIAGTAANEGKEPQEICDKVGFVKMWEKDPCSCR